ncbi:MAG: acyl carrier protein [Chitinispirillales bacterium]|jgi:acyl carrier protein|nr:acyl carrier protein [Chitinispirillales bacterium]
MIEKLQQIIREAKGDEKINITPETVLLTDLKLDSFDVAQLVNEIEIGFGIKVEDRDINELKTIKNILDYIERKKK